MNKNKRSAHRASQGFTLVELLVGIALGTFLLLGLVSATVGLLRGEVVTTSRMSTELRNSAFVIERDLSRAGYHGAAAAALLAGPAAYANPFSTLDVSTPGCVLYSYDLNGNGTLDTAPESDERFAVAMLDGQLFMRRSGADYDCDVTKGVWEPLMDANLLHVTDFTVSVDSRNVDIPNSTRKLQVRTVTYTVSTSLKKEPAKTMKHTNTLVLPNDILS